MTEINPLRPLHEEAEGTFMDYGPGGIELVESFGQYEAEYAAIRKGVGVMDRADRGLVRLTGGDRREFLQRMLTNDVGGLEAGSAVRAFRLNNKGRITGDLTVIEHGDRTDIELDATDAAGCAGELDRYLFSEDVVVEDVTGGYRQLGLYGPKGWDLLRGVAGEGVAELEGMRQVEVQIGQWSCTVLRRDETGSVGLHVVVEREGVVDVYRALMRGAPGVEPRGVGWSAYNTARIEGGTPLYHIDFGPDTLPHETGAVIERAVSFTKGCYAGQEVVARMQNLGHPKRVLVGLRVESDGVAVAGTQVFEVDGAVEGRVKAGGVIGAVTSSTLSPMLSGKSIAFAMVKWGQHREGSVVAVAAEGEVCAATVGTLAFV